jgi:hypothetical protein
MSQRGLEFENSSDNKMGESMVPKGKTFVAVILILKYPLWAEFCTKIASPGLHK